MDPTELSAALEEHHGAASGWALTCCGWDGVMAEDVRQASYLKVLEGRAAFAGRSSFKTWLFGVIRRTAAEHRRQRLLRRMVPLGPRERARESAWGDPAAELERTESVAVLLAALRALPARQREVLHLVFYQDLTIREAADVLGISIGTARTHYERGKERLRDLLSGERP
jgi:RNA polymerase sigma-70 factor (ECF subfamily)